VIIAIEFAGIGAVVADVFAASGTGLPKAAGVSVNRKSKEWAEIELPA
jgi:hypothetical protein